MAGCERSMPRRRWCWLRLDRFAIRDSLLFGPERSGPVLSYHIRNVPAFSTIEMSPGCGFTIPRKKPVFSCAASLVATDDCWPVTSPYPPRDVLVQNDA